MCSIKPGVKISTRLVSKFGTFDIPHFEQKQKVPIHKNIINMVCTFTIYFHYWHYRP